MFFKVLRLLILCSVVLLPLNAIAADNSSNSATSVANSTADIPDANASNLDASKVLNMSLAELTNIEVTSVSKTPEKENEAAAAIFVITADDIKHSGATTIPDLLRMVPGVTVTQAGAHDWTVTARGSNGQFSN